MDNISILGKEDAYEKAEEKFLFDLLHHGPGAGAVHGFLCSGSDAKMGKHKNRADDLKFFRYDRELQRVFCGLIRQQCYPDQGNIDAQG